MKGSTRDCFYHLLQLLDKKKKLALAGVMANLFGISEKTVTDWFRKVSFPQGLNLIKVQHLLGLLGFEPDETRELSSAAAHLRPLLIYGVFTPELIGEMLGVKAESILRIAKGNSGTRAGREEVMSVIYLRKSEVLDKKKEIWKEELDFLQLPSLPTVQKRLADRDGFMPPRVDETQPYCSQGIQFPKLAQNPKDLALNLLAMQIIQILPLATRVASDEFSAADRDVLRKLVGSGKIFELKNELVRLCGERARDLANKEGVCDE